MSRYYSVTTGLSAVIALTFATSSTFGIEHDQPSVAGLILEARTVAAAIEDPISRTYALARVTYAQDPSGALESLRIFPDMPNRHNHLLSIMFNFAKAGNVKAAEEIFAELKKSSLSDHNTRIVTANGLGYVAVAYANAGKLDIALRRLAELKQQYEGENFAIFLDATARIAEAHARHGDLMGGIDLAKSIAGEQPYPLMNIVGGCVRANDLPGALKIVSGLDEWLQQYAKWGIVSAQRELGDLRTAQSTATTINPGHARASAFLELANHYLDLGDKSSALSLLQESASAAPSTVNNWTRADTLWRIAAAMAKSEDTNHALKIAQSIEKAGHRKSAISDIVTAQAEQKKFEEAFDTASLLQPSGSDDESGTEAYVHALTEIFTQMVRANRTKEARETAARFDGLTSHRARLFSAIAAAQADLDDVQGARMTLSYAESDKQRAARRKEMARLIGLLKQGQDSEALQQLSILQDREYDTLPALEATALAYARRASPSEASKIANDLNFHNRVDLYDKIGNTLMVSSHKTTALEWARALSSPADKAYALVGIARAISTSKQKGNPIK